MAMWPKSGRLHYCENGIAVTEQVMKFRKTRKSDDFVPVQKYYHEFRHQWYLQLEDYLDEESFNGEFDFKLIKAVDSFNDDESKKLASKNGWSDTGRFNRWFYKILTNWKSNVKNSSFRLKKRPSIQCPICGRFVGRIDVEHLKHYKTTSDLPDYFVMDDKIFEVSAAPKLYAVSWGEYTKEKWNILNQGRGKEIQKSKVRVAWPWRIDGDRAVVCPFTKKIILIIDDEYLQSLPNRYNRYAAITSWEKFIEDYPNGLMQSELFSLDHVVSEDDYLSDCVSKDNRCANQTKMINYKSIKNGSIPHEYENVFNAIDTMIMDNDHKDILKLIATGYSIEDISDTLSVDEKEIKTILKQVRQNSDFELVLKGN